MIDPDSYYGRLTEEQRDAVRKRNLARYHRMKADGTLKPETEEQRRKRIEYLRKRRANMTPGQLEEERKKQRDRYRNLTDEQREFEKNRCREYVKKRINGEIVVEGSIWTNEYRNAYLRLYRTLAKEEPGKRKAIMREFRDKWKAKLKKQ